jgi:hypothetical protein
MWADLLRGPPVAHRVGGRAVTKESRPPMVVAHRVEDRREPRELRVRQGVDPAQRIVGAEGCSELTTLNIAPCRSTSPRIGPSSSLCRIDPRGRVIERFQQTARAPASAPRYRWCSASRGARPIGGWVERGSSAGPSHRVHEARHRNGPVHPIFSKLLASWGRSPANSSANQSSRQPP